MAQANQWICFIDYENEKIFGIIFNIGLCSEFCGRCSIKNKDYSWGNKGWRRDVGKGF